MSTLGQATFYYCTQLKKVLIPDSIESIEDDAFSWCNNLKSIYIPESVKTISPEIFSYCKSTTIYGTKGSAAQKYAKSAGFTFVEVKKYTDSASGVSVYANVPTGSELKVSLQSSSENRVVYDIFFIKNGVKINPKGIARIYLPTPTISKTADREVYAIKNNMETANLDSYYQDNYSVFETTSLGEFSVKRLICGDANGDCNVDITDAMLLFYHVARKILWILTQQHCVTQMMIAKLIYRML